MAAIKKILKDKEIHLSVCRGTVAQNEAYCSKEETCVDPMSRSCFGKCPEEKEAGLMQNQYESLKQAILAGQQTEKIMLDHFELAVRHGHHVQRMINILQKPPARRPVTNLCIWGDSGSGKTSWIYETFDADDVYMKDKSKWWDGYTGQKVVVYDDFYGNIKVGEVLNLIDVYRVQVETKGGTVFLRNSVNIFTSNEPPENWYVHIPQKVQEALQRRMPPSNVKELRSGQKPPKFEEWAYETLSGRDLDQKSENCDCDNGTGNTSLSVVTVSALKQSKEDCEEESDVCVGNLAWR